MDKRRLIVLVLAWAGSIVVLSVLLTFVLPFWVQLPVGIVCGYIIGEAMCVKLLDGLPPSE